MSDARLPADTRMGPAHLRVRDLDAERAFYERALGLRALRAQGDVVELGADAPVLVLHAAPSAPERPPRSTGLFHVAILLPDRAALARFLRHALAEGAPLEGASDHHVSEALYLTDPEGNGLEVYADRPREAWGARDGRVPMTTARLDLDDLLAADARPWLGMPEGTRVGHVHLQVDDVPRSESFYRDGLGLDVTARYGPDASFLSAGGYHHHVAVNAWGTRGGRQPPDGALGLERYVVEVPREALDDVETRLRQAGALLSRDAHAALARDPAGNVVELRAT